MTFGDAVLRVGLAESAELQIGITSHVTMRVKVRTTRAVSRLTGTGDAVIAIRRGLAGPNGPIAVMAYVTLPLGEPPIGAGRVEGGVLLPATVSLPADFELDLTPELDLLADEEGRGRHLNWGSAAELSHKLGDHLTLAAQIAAYRNEEPGDHATDARAGATLAWRIGERFQIDVEANAGLTSGAPDRTLAGGIAWRFR